ncbi:TIM barrel protein [Aestuariicella hydrocarbonica]|uniref:TIM barrel protein n=1 Tax=Pseudomaricurvus hydrocarbonicus TaxID=1470433 RepID=A0A9E5JWM0_9GAMM|nr:TIM barrel protein [Aestuariicella hydrocarbonica]NHO66841.1 TIM barrel protein [Aestuariicella hydrocarbonica]
MRNSTLNFSLWPACVRNHTFEQQLAAAARHGFSHLPIGLPTYRHLTATGKRPRDIRALAADYGVQLGHYDGFSGWAPVKYNSDLPAAAKQVFAASADECLAICESLGLKRICATGTFSPDQFPMEVLSDHFALFCDKAKTLEIQVDLEFLPMWGIPDLATAWNIYQPYQPSNAGILFDCWHFFRGNPDWQLLAKLPTNVIKTVQLADAALRPVVEDLFEECLQLRELPGKGELPLLRLLALLQRQQLTDIGPEIFSAQLDQLPANLAAQQAAETCRNLLKTTNLTLPSAG